MLSFKKVSIDYQGHRALEDFSLDVARGEIVALVGESGSGKTTAIRAALGLLPAGGRLVEGDISFQGQSLLGKSTKDWEALRGKDISMIFQDSGAMLSPIRTIGSQFVEYIRIHEPMDKKAAWDKAKTVLERMGLFDSQRIMKSYSFQLSGGMRQRVGIAMAMTFWPKLLLADEPTSALDVTTQAEIVKEMIKLRQDYDTSIVLVTHNLGVASYMADRLVVMKEGRIVELGPAEEVIKQPKASYTKKLIEAVPDMRSERYV